MTKRPILVVEDDPGLRASLARILRAEGHDVVEAASADAAVALGREHEPSLVVVADVVPGMDGVGLLCSLRAALDDRCPPAVWLTSSALHPARAFELGAKVSLCKPFQVEDLLRAVALHLRATVTARD